MNSLVIFGFGFLLGWSSMFFITWYSLHGYVKFAKEHGYKE